MDLLEDLVDVRRVGFSTLLGLLASGGLLRGLGGLLGWGLGHFDDATVKRTTTKDC